MVQSHSRELHTMDNMSTTTVSEGKRGDMATVLSKELLFLIRQSCVEENLLKTAHTLEQETGFFFDMRYFEDLVLCGNWNDAEKYLSGFTRVEDNNYSLKIYFEMRKQKFLEALDKHEVATALEILIMELKVFAPLNEEVYREMTLLLTMEDFRNHPSLSMYGDVISARRQMMNEIKLVIEANPQFHRKLEIPEIEKSRLRRLINQSLNWQHARCPTPQAEPHIETLFTDHRCLDQPSDKNPLSSKTPSASIALLSSKSIVCPSTAPEPNVSASAANLGTLSNQEGINDSGNASKDSSSTSVDETVSLPSAPIQRQNSNSNLFDDFPKTVERSVAISSPPTSMDFHPFKETLLLVGKSTGDIELWDIISEAKLFWNAFMIWKREAISVLFLKDLEKYPSISVNHVSWSADGSVFGVAYSKHIVQLYSYHAHNNYTEKQLEIDAHFGSVNDLAFSSPYGELLVITCGDDKLIQVWDAMTGSKQYTFEGHSDSVYSVCPHVKEDIRLQFVFSTSTNGEIKAWLFDNTGPKVQFNAPGYSCMRMAYSADGKRLFSCGTNKDGESYIVEWNESEGYISRTFHGLCKLSEGVVQFCTSGNRFLAAGDEHLIKVWDIDNVELLTAIDAGGGLPACPYICFSKKGSLLAVLGDHNKIKILANDVGHQLLQTSTFFSVDSPGYLSESLKNLGINSAVTARVRVEDGSFQMEENMKTQVPFELNKALDTQKCSKIFQVSRCRSLRLPTQVKTNKICRLLYANSGNGILALAADGIHLFWRWSGNESNSFGKATTNYSPQLWQPRSGLLMINDLPDDHFPVASTCFALSKNDSYLVSSSGKMVSLFNTVTFKKMKTCILPSPVATCLAFYPPDNNIIAIGMDDSTILIYNVRLGQVTHMLRGHFKRLSGLAFSNTLKVLISCGVDTQIIVWDSNRWEKKNTALLQISVEWSPSESSETYVQFHQDQKHFLAVHETQLAIYETTSLERVKQWMIGNFCARITHATLSSDNQLVYAVMRDGIILILSVSDLSPRVEIDPSIYLPPNISCRVYPLVITAHPMKPNQFALGLSDGGVVVIEPHESDGKWISEPGFENVEASRIIIA